MVLVTVVLGHELTYLLAHGPSGYDVAMGEAGHERYWSTFVFAVGAIAAALIVVVAAQLIRLRRLATGLDDPGNASPRQFLGLVGRLWLRNGSGAAAVYLVQENVESVTAGHYLPGLAVFANDHLIALPLILLVALAVAVIGALVAWRRDALLRRLRTAAPGLRRRAPRFARDSGISDAPSLHVGEANGVRAPPVVGYLPA